MFNSLPVYYHTFSFIPSYPKNFFRKFFLGFLSGFFGPLRGSRTVVLGGDIMISTATVTQEGMGWKIVRSWVDKDGCPCRDEKEEEADEKDIWLSLSRERCSVLVLPKFLFFKAKAGISGVKKSDPLALVSGSKGFANTVKTLYSWGTILRVLQEPKGPLRGSRTGAIGGKNLKSSALGNFNFCYKKKGC